MTKSPGYEGKCFTYVFSHSFCPILQGVSTQGSAVSGEKQNSSRNLKILLGIWTVAMLVHMRKKAIITPLFRLLGGSKTGCDFASSKVSEGEKIIEQDKELQRQQQTAAR